MIIRSKAPYRISFGGGGTDVPPYCWDHGGAVVSTTINKYAYATLMANGDKRANVHSVDFDLNKSFALEQLEYNGCLDLVKAAINEFKVREGIDLSIHGDMPPGSGMGTSSSMATALLGCLKELVGKRMSKEEIAKLACHIEREELCEKGGYQDQYAAVFGGLNYIEFYKHEVRVNPIKLSSELLNELEYHLLLFFTGKTRLSSDVHKDMENRYKEKAKDYLDGLDNLKLVAQDMKRALLNGDLKGFGELLHEGWIQKQKLSSKVATTETDKLYKVARKNGAVGGKILGAGSGGHLLLFCEPDRRFEVIHELNKCGVTMVPFEFESKGLQTWRA